MTQNSAVARRFHYTHARNISFYSHIIRTVRVSQVKFSLYANLRINYHSVFKFRVNFRVLNFADVLQIGRGGVAVVISAQRQDFELVRIVVCGCSSAAG